MGQSFYHLFIILLIFSSCVQNEGRTPADERIFTRNADPICSDVAVECPGGVTYIDNKGLCREFCPELVSGYNMKGDLESCYDVTATDRTACTAVMMEGDYFGLHCQELGGDAISCGCHSNLCSIDISEGGAKQFGLDKQGRFRGCVPTATLAQCDGNTFSQQCESTGQKVIACDCEQFLCTTP
jgi:hypothetical protein